MTCNINNNNNLPATMGVLDAHLDASTVSTTAVSEPVKRRLVDYTKKRTTTTIGLPISISSSSSSLRQPVVPFGTSSRKLAIHPNHKRRSKSCATPYAHRVQQQVRFPSFRSVEARRCKSMQHTSGLGAISEAHVVQEVPTCCAQQEENQDVVEFYLKVPRRHTMQTGCHDESYTPPPSTVGIRTDNKGPSPRRATGTTNERTNSVVMTMLRRAESEEKPKLPKAGHRMLLQKASSDRKLQPSDLDSEMPQGAQEKGERFASQQGDDITRSAQVEKYLSFAARV